MDLKDLQAIADLTVERLGRAHVPPIRLKNTLRGRAGKDFISIPLWVIHYPYPLEFVIYYVVHEVCHYFYGFRHDRAFKAGETKTLSLWGLKPIYARAYIKKLIGDNGNIVYDKKTIQNGM